MTTASGFDKTHPSLMGAGRVVHEPMFRSIEDALRIAYVVAEREMLVKSSTLVVIEDLMEQRYGLAPTIAADRRVNTGTLSPIEFRGQCARVRAVVENIDNLAGINNPQRYAILCRYAYQRQRLEAVLNLRDHMESLCNTRSRDAIAELIYGRYDRRTNAGSKAVLAAKGDFSLRAIEKKYGIAKSILHRDQQRLNEHIHKLELSAVGMLDSYFTRTGLVGEFVL